MAKALFVGRFQPFHYGHLHAIQSILKEVKDLIRVVGSAQMSHEPDNPFTAGERIEMIKAALKDAILDLEQIMLIPIADAPSQCIVTTNGEPLDRFSMEEIKQLGVDRIVISLNAYSKEMYEKINVGLDFN